ncbi:hypothetical protein C470_11923 [Halorubrum distributum JCM 13561]|uniref:Putative peptidase inhibitor domain-containing protein n=1 Tax=Halorubrum distributum JCM 13561 TaxID=1227483 RepID=M0NNH8_9EURY|nr:hypothetical protein [Halorubrum litoreum]EMA58724.1 hypothetical protein C470_11923 [Halorubrum litoreum JCM 13561]
MPLYVDRDTQDMRDDPERDTSVELLVGFNEGSADQLKQVVRDQGGQIVEVLPFQTIKVAVPQTAIEAVCTVDGVESVETDAKLDDLSQGDF